MSGLLLIIIISIWVWIFYRLANRNRSILRGHIGFAYEEFDILYVSLRWLREKAGLSQEEAEKIVMESRCPKWLVKFVPIVIE